MSEQKSRVRDDDWIPCHRRTVEAIIALAPHREQDIRDAWNGGRLSKDAGAALLKALTENAEAERQRKAERRRAKFAQGGAGAAEQAHRQSASALAERHAEELRKDPERAAREARWAQAEEEVREARALRNPQPNREELIIRHWGEARIFAEAQERRFRQMLDPYGLGLYGAESIDDVVARQDRTR
jgi:hypothetical protein